MNLFSSFIGKKAVENKAISLGYTTELHNHLLPGIDDGVVTIDESIEIIKVLITLGIKKIITTPHFKTDIYNNSPEIIRAKLNEVQQAISADNLDVIIEASSEYFLDEYFLAKIKSNEPLLSFGSNHILFETSHVDYSPLFVEAVFLLSMQGYKPIFAHPERYQYAFNNFSVLERMYDSGVFFQLNINSLHGYYGKDAQRQAKLLVEKEMVDFVGTDAHGLRHISILEKSIATKEYQTLLASGKLMNNTI